MSTPSERTPRISRRGVIVGGTALAAGAAVGPGRGLIGLLGWWNDPARLERSSMQQHLAERFALAAPDGGTIELVLQQIDELPTREVSNPEGQFAARFAAPSGTSLAQDTYAMSSPRFGAIQLFLSPVHDTAGNVAAYEALFNRPEVTS